MFVHIYSKTDFTKGFKLANNQMSALRFLLVIQLLLSFSLRSIKDKVMDEMTKLDSFSILGNQMMYFFHKWGKKTCLQCDGKKKILNFAIVFNQAAKKGQMTH